MIRGQVIRGDGASIVADGDYEDCTFVAPGCDPVVIVLERASFRRCRIEGGTNRGLVVNQGRADLDDCVIVGNRLGVWAGRTGQVHLRDCRLEGPGSAGVFFHRGAIGTVDRCAIDGFVDGAIVVRSGGSPLITDCVAHNIGIVAQFFEDARGELRGCTLRGGVWVAPGAAPILEDCEIRDAQSVGVGVGGGGRYARLRLIDNNVGFYVQGGGDPSVCDVIAVGGNLGLYAAPGAKGRFDRCDFESTLIDASATTVLSAATEDPR